MVMAVSHVLHTADRSSSLAITLNQTTTSLAILRDGRELTPATIKGLPGLRLKSATPGSFVAKSNSATMAIRVEAELFHISLRNEESDFVELEVPLGTDSWYGLGHFMRQSWPLETASLDFGPFYPFDNGPTGVCTHVDPTVISTSGLLVKADDSSPCLHVGLNSSPVHTHAGRKWTTGSLNQLREILPLCSDESQGDGLLRIQSRRFFDSAGVGHPWWDDSERHGHRAITPELRFALGATQNVRTACDLLLAHVADKPRKSPPIELLRDPIWTTWAQYGVDVDQQKVLEYASNVVSRDLPRSVLEIDDRWSPKYGDLEFDLDKFPRPLEMVERLHELGFKVTLWVTPFAAMDSKAIADEQTRVHFMSDENGQTSSFEWWQPTNVAGLNVADDAACEWFVSRLQRLCDEFKIDGFKFDAGESCFVPPDSAYARDCRAPAEYTRQWINKVASHFDVSEVRSSAQRCQEKAPMVRMLDLYSTWTLDNGLASVLSTTLTSGLLGFPFVLPDMIGGNAYANVSPDAELMIRWAQLNAGLPSMQFSIAPWSFDKRCDELCRLALRWRSDVFWPRINRAIGDACESYTPIVRPMWWVDQSPAMAEIYDQYLVGDDLVVAPIIEQGGVERTVTLPAGLWRRVQLRDVEAQHDKSVIRGGVETRVSAELDDMPVFERVLES